MNIIKSPRLAYLTSVNNSIKNTLSSLIEIVLLLLLFIELK